MQTLVGKIAVVTGGSRGIGAAIALRLAADGAKVIVNYARNAEAAAQVAAQITAAGGEAAAVRADISDLTQIEPLFDAAMERFGRLDILVNNAGVSEARPLEATDAAFYARIFDTNVRGALFCAQAAARRFDAAGGRIIGISSSITLAPGANWAVYAGSKAALETMTASLAAELGSRHITVNAVAPGVTETDMLQEVMPADVQQSLVAATPLGRLGQPADIAAVVAFLASEAGGWITGQVIVANGGLR